MIWRRLTDMWRGSRSLLDVFAMVGGQATTATCSLVAALVQGRLVAPATLGYFSAFAIPAGYLTILHLGSLTTLQKEYPYWLAKGEIAKAHRAAQVTQGWVLLVGLIVALGFATLGACRAIVGDARGAAGWCTQAVVASVSFYLLYLGCIYRSTRDFARWSGLMVVVSLSMVSMLIFVAIWEYWGLCLKVAVPTLLAVLLLHIARPLKVAPLLNFRELWTMVRFGLPMDLSGFLATSVMTSTLLALVAWRWGVATLGLFAFAGLAESLMHQLSAAFSQVFIPRIAYRLGQHDDLRSCAHYAARPALAGLASLAGVGVVASLLCAPVIRVLVPAYAEAVPLMCITLWAGLYPVATLPGHVLIAAGRNHSMAGVYLSTFLVFALAAAVVLAAELPAMYMAAAYVAGKAGGAAAAWGLLWRQMACSPTGRAMVEAS